MNPQDWLHYTGKRAVVTGCHSGIGHATARQLIALGTPAPERAIQSGQGKPV